MLSGWIKPAWRPTRAAPARPKLLEPSPVLAAMGVDAERSLRLSVGWSTTDAEVAMAERALPA